MRFSLSVVVLSCLLAGCSSKDEPAKAAAAAVTPVPEKERVVIPDAALAKKIELIQKGAEAAEALIPLPESSCFAIGTFEAEMSALHVVALEEVVGAKELLKRLGDIYLSSNSSCAGADIGREVDWREKYLPAVYARLALLKEGNEKGMLNLVPPARDSANVKSKMYAILLRWAKHAERIKHIRGTFSIQDEANIADYQYYMARDLVGLAKELESRETEINEHGASSQLSRVRSAIGAMAAPAVKGKAGFEESNQAYAKLIEALQTLSDAVLK